MAKTLFLAEKDEATYLQNVGAYFDGGMPESFRAFAVAHREEGFSAAYTAYMIKTVEEQLTRAKLELMK